MSLPQIIGAGNSSALPGYIISPLRFREFGIAEERFAEWHIQRAERGVRRASTDVAQGVINTAIRHTESGAFSYGMPEFRLRCLSSRGLSLILWLSLRIKHPQITFAQAKDLRDGAASQDALTDAVMEAAGFTESSLTNEINQGQQPPSSGGASSQPSVAAA